MMRDWGDMMINAEDKKNIVVVVLILIVLLGSLFFVKSCNRKEFIDEEPSEQEKLPDDNEEEPDQETGEEENTDVEEELPEEMNNPVIPTVIPSPKPPEKEEEEALPPVVSIPDNVVLSLHDENFVLPTVGGVDEKGIPLRVEISYYFKVLNAVDYSPVFAFSTDQVGTYKIVYRVTNSSSLTTVKEMIVEIIDNEAPTIEGMIEEYDPESGLISFIPVANGSLINQMITIKFRDNDRVSYAEYYKQIDPVDSGDTIEQEPLPEVIPIDPTQELVLYEDGEYHVRAYDESGNITEYVVTIDCTNPVISVTYTKKANATTVQITSDEELQPVEGWVLSEDQKVLTKEYTVDTEEIVSLFDLAGNQVDIPILVEVDYARVQVYQDGKLTTSDALNIVDGDITIHVESNLDDYQVIYTIDGGVEQIYQEGDLLTTAGSYSVSIYSMDGTLYDTIEFFISTDLGGD